MTSVIFIDWIIEIVVFYSCSDEYFYHIGENIIHFNLSLDINNLKYFDFQLHKVIKKFPL